MRVSGILMLCAVLLALAVPASGFAQAETCVPDAQFVSDVTVPDDTVLKPGEAFQKVWRFKNSGKCEWTKGFGLAWVEGDLLGVSKTQSLAETVASGATVDIAVNMQAPEQAGTYTSWWRLQDDKGVPFGQKFYVRIIVAPEAGAGEPGATPVGTPAGGGASSASELLGWLVWETRNPDMTKVSYDIHISKPDGTDSRVLWQWGPPASHQRL